LNAGDIQQKTDNGYKVSGWSPKLYFGLHAYDVPFDSYRKIKEWDVAEPIQSYLKAVAKL
jgi:hypothetical protein